MGQTISEIGSRITREGLPLTAVLVLGATPAQMGILSATGAASVLLFSFAAGVIVDRMRRRPVMIAADLGRAALLSCVPVLALSHRLSITGLILIAGSSGVLTVLFDVAYQSYLPSLLCPQDLLDGNRFLAMSSATAEILGPSLTGVLVQLITAPIAVLLDALSFVVSGACVWSIRHHERTPEPSSGTPLIEETLQGIRAIHVHPALRALLFRSVAAFLSMGVVFSFYILYAIRVLHLNPASLGFAIALGGVGSLMGGFLAGRVTRGFGMKVSFIGSAVIIGCTQLLIPLAGVHPRFGLLCLCVQQLVGDCAWTIYFVNETTLRQSLMPAELLGRVNAAMQFASRGMLAIGALAGGFLAGSIGIPYALWTGATGVLLSTFGLIPLLRSTRATAAPQYSGR